MWNSLLKEFRVYPSAVCGRGNWDQREPGELSERTRGRGNVSAGGDGKRMVAGGTDSGFAKIARPGISSIEYANGRAAIDSTAFRREVVVGAMVASSHSREWLS